MREGAKTRRCWTRRCDRGLGHAPVRSNLYVRLRVFCRTALVATPSPQSRIASRGSLGSSQGQMVVGDWINTSDFASVELPGNFRGLLTAGPS